MRLLVVLLLMGCADDGESLREPTTRLVETNFGELLAAQFTDAQEIDVPADALSLTVVVQSDLAGILSLEIEAPDGTLLTDALAPLDSPNPVYAWTRVTVAQVPIRPEVELAPGRYRVRAFYGGSQAMVSLRAFVKRPLGPDVDVDADGQVLTLTLLYATDTVAPGDDDLDRAFDEAVDVWANAGIEVRRGDEYQLADVGVVSDEGPALDELLARSAGLAPRAVPAFLVEDLVTADSEDVAGLTATIPLPPLDGTPRSGILLSTASLREFPDLTGQILAHEIGHALGLAHTTEPDGVQHDMLADTAECTVANDTDADGTLAISECRDRDATNLLFWACCASHTPSLTEDQSFVALRSALAR